MSPRSSAMQTNSSSGPLLSQSLDLGLPYTETSGQETNCSYSQTNQQVLKGLLPSQGLKLDDAVICAHNGRASSAWTPLIPVDELELRRELRSYKHLEANWDGDGAERPSAQAVDDAFTFLNKRPKDIPPPYPEVSTEGDVGVYWNFRSKHVFAEVSFDGDGTFSYFAKRGKGNIDVFKCGIDGVSITNNWPDDMLKILRSQNIS